MSDPLNPKDAVILAAARGVLEELESSLSNNIWKAEPLEAYRRGKTAETVSVARSTLDHALIALEVHLESERAKAVLDTGEEEPEEEEPAEETVYVGGDVELPATVAEYRDSFHSVKVSELEEA